MEFWLGLPAWLRVVLGLVVMGIGGLVIWQVVQQGTVSRRSGYTFGFGLLGLGFAMIVFGGKSDSERNGYNF